jgi:hypothetical protein
MDDWDKAVDMRGHGSGWAEIERATGITVSRLRHRLDPVYRRQHAANRAGMRAIAGIRVEHNPTPAEFARLLASIPRDTRGLTARILGDPIPERSALYRKMGGE